MSVVRRRSAGAVVAGLVLLGGPAWAQEDPCAPGPEEPPGEDGVMCAFGAPASGPAEFAPVEESAPVDSIAAELPRTGPQDRLLALAAVGSGILVLGAGAVAAGRRRRSQV